MVKSNHIDLAEISLPNGSDRMNKEWNIRSAKIENKLNTLNLEKNKELFDELEGKYIDRLNLIENQQETMKNQNTILNNHKKNIVNNKEKLEEYNNKLMINNRLNLYDIKYDKIKLKINNVLKMSLFILSMILIAVLIYKYKKNISFN